MFTPADSVQNESEDKDIPSAHLESHPTYSYRLSDNSSIALDFIRAVAAQMVVVGHGISFFGIAKVLHEPSFPWIQNIAVLIFFILSGLLITYSTFRKKRRLQYGFGAFMIERFSRIYSGFLPAIFFVILADILFIQIYGNSAYSFPLNLRTLVGNILMLQDYPLAPSAISVTSFGSARPFWTIAVEWWIYLFFGAFVFCNFSFKGIAKYSSVLLVAGVVAACNSIQTGRGNGLFLVWLMGASLAFLLTYNDRLSLRKSAALAMVFLAAGCVRVLWIKNAYDLPFALFLAGAIFFLLRALDQSDFSLGARTRKIIRFTADYSFTLYLLHYSVLFFFTPLGKTMNPYVAFALGVLVSNGIAATIAIFTEMKHRHLTSFLLRKFNLQHSPH